MKNRKVMMIFAVFCMLMMFTACRAGSDNRDLTVQEHDSDFHDDRFSDEMIVEFNAFNVATFLQYQNGNLYFRVGSSYSGNPLETFYRYHVCSDLLTTVCGDPVCSHSDRSCPFYAMGKHFAVCGNQIVYTREFPFGTEGRAGGEPFYELVNYDAEQLQMKRYSEKKGLREKAWTRELYSGRYRFYYEAVKDEETQEYYFSLCRMNLDDGAVAVLRENTSTEEGLVPISGHNMGNVMLFAVGDRLYFSNGGEIYSTDFDLNDKEVIMTGRFTSDQIYTDGEYIFWGQTETEGSGILTLYRTKLDGGEKMPLGIQAYRFTLTQNYIYYENTEVVTIGQDDRSGSSLDVLTEVGSALCRASHDGSGQEEVFRYQQGDTFYVFSAPCYIDNKIYTLYSTYTDIDKDGAIGDDEYFVSFDPETYTILCVDPVTGEMDFIPCGTENRVSS